MILPPPPPTLFPYTTLFRSLSVEPHLRRVRQDPAEPRAVRLRVRVLGEVADREPGLRSEEHTSELQSRFDLVCRLRLEKKIRTCSCHTSKSASEFVINSMTC